MDSAIAAALGRAAAGDGPVVFLTGAGISAESGVPTFRGRDGYWVVGSRNYHPEELATRAAFGEIPDEVWRWYLYRRTVCRAAEPNPAHRALAELEAALGDDLLLVTQNVDGLHLRAGSTSERTYQIHGNIDFMRCAGSCPAELVALPDATPAIDRDGPLPDEVAATLRCPRCGERARPHVLWFDECYDEALYRFESSLRAATRCRLLVTVGSSGSTNLPTQMAALAARRAVPVIDINPDDNLFGELAAASGGAHWASPASEAVPALVERIRSWG